MVPPPNPRPTLLVQLLVAALVVVVGVGTEGAKPERIAAPGAPRVARSATAHAAAGPAGATRVPRAAVGSAWTGLAFDTCRAPSQHAMDQWLVRSPFIGVGVYIGGPLRACAQRHLTRPWVSRQLRRGWKLLPLWVGPQASCTGYRRRIDPGMGSRGLYPGAGRQGVTAAHGAAAAARALGIPGGTTLWYDIEPFPTRVTRCRRSALRFLSSWTLELHRRGYRSGVYSTLSAAVTALAHAPVRGPRGYTSPDHVWFAWANHRADSWLGGRRYLGAPGWKAHRRVHQYALDQPASYGGVRLAIDRSFVDLGHSVDARRPGPCGRDADLRRYPSLRTGASGRGARAAQCLLGFAGHPGPVSEAGLGPLSRAAILAFQRRHRLPASGRTDRATWTALLASGSRPVVKRGSVGGPVRRVQRALNAALPVGLRVTGVFGARTASAVRRYQRRVGAPTTGVVATATWNALAHGRLSAPHRARRAGHQQERHHARHHVVHRVRRAADRRDGRPHVRVHRQHRVVRTVERLDDAVRRHLARPGI